MLARPAKKCRKNANPSDANFQEDVNLLEKERKPGIRLHHARACKNRSLRLL